MAPPSPIAAATSTVSKRHALPGANVERLTTWATRSHESIVRENLHWMYHHPMTTPQSVSGFSDFRDYQTWYQIAGDLDSWRTPLVVLHGGPGMAHNYLCKMEGLAEDGWPVILYDQLGCGQSTHLPDAPNDFWTVELFLEELDALLTHLGISSNYHLYGQSWGGMLAAEHAVGRPEGLKSLILSNSLASSELWAQGADRLRAQLPAATLKSLERHETAGTMSDPEYIAALEEYYARHVCRVPPPDFVQASFDQLAKDPTVYHTMWGPNEFAPTGSLKNWTIVDRLSAISVPTLVISGEFDEATIECQQPFIEKIADVRQVIVAGASHLSMVEQPETYFRFVSDFLRHVSPER
jgi:L-proline amide hydrolase